MVQKKKYNRCVFHVYVCVILIDFCGLKFNVSFIFIKSYKKGQSCSNIFKKKLRYKIYDTKKKPKKKPRKKQTQNNPSPPPKKNPSKQSQLFLSAYDIYCMFFFVAEVTRIDPFFGSTNGGTRVTIYGSGNKHFVFS